MTKVGGVGSRKCLDLRDVIYECPLICFGIFLENRGNSPGLFQTCFVYNISKIGSVAYMLLICT